MTPEPAAELNPSAPSGPRWALRKRRPACPQVPYTASVGPAHAPRMVSRKRGEFPSEASTWRRSQTSARGESWHPTPGAIRSATSKHILTACTRRASAGAHVRKFFALRSCGCQLQLSCNGAARPVGLAPATASRPSIPAWRTKRRCAAEVGPDGHALNQFAAQSARWGRGCS